MVVFQVLGCPVHVRDLWSQSDSAGAGKGWISLKAVLAPRPPPPLLKHPLQGAIESDKLNLNL